MARAPHHQYYHWLVFAAVFLMGSAVVSAAWRSNDAVIDRLSLSFTQSVFAQSSGAPLRPTLTYCGTTQVSCGGGGTPQCSDQQDNDGDGRTDMSDPDCLSPSDDNEFDSTGGALHCNDGLDNDSDGKCDAPGATCTDGSQPGDPDCTDANDNSEVGQSNISWGHTYPRLANQHFGNSPADWYGRFDLILTVDNSGNRIAPIKSVNPNTKVIYTQGVTGTGGKDDPDKICAGWSDNLLARMSNGEIARANSGWSVKIADMTNIGRCNSLSGACTGGAKRYNQLVPACLAGFVTTNGYDGGGTDWMWKTPSPMPICHGGTQNGKFCGDKSPDGPGCAGGGTCKPNIDFDRNGANDYDEHGTNWVDATYQEGLGIFVANWRAAIGANPAIWINSGTLHDASDIPGVFENSNGLMFEKKSGFTGFNSVWNQYQQWMSKGRTPHTWISDIRPAYGDPQSRVNGGHTKNHFRLMRMMLGWTLMGDGYFEFNPAECEEHHCYSYFDEYDAPLGYPTPNGGPHTLSTGVMVRFFDGGVAITNPNNSDRSISDTDLRSLSGYVGPYYRFKGNQDPGRNNGVQLTTAILLPGYPFGTNSVGDGLILLKTPATIVSDIVIDNTNHFTSPGSAGVSVTGTWNDSTENTNSWSHKEVAGKGFFSYKSNTGSGAASFNPTINVAGRYEVYEWHGETSGTESTSVAHTLTYANNGSVTKQVNQAINPGEWNSLGVYQFTAGSNQGVDISGSGPAGSVQADAIMFRYRGTGAIP